MKPVDDFYVFEKGAAADIPTRLPVKELESNDLIEDLVQPTTKAIKPVVELSSDKSGLKLEFSTNREFFQASAKLTHFY